MTQTELLKIAYDAGFQQALKEAGFLQNLQQFWQGTRGSVGKMTAEEAARIATGGKKVAPAMKPLVAKQPVETTRRLRGLSNVVQANERAGLGEVDQLANDFIAQMRARGIGSSPQLNVV